MEKQASNPKILDEKSEHDMKKTHIYSTILVLAISLSAVGFAYSGWRDEVRITGTAKMGRWKACIRIRKTLDGAYYLNPDTGELEGPTPNIHIAADHPTYFYLTICVKNRRSTTLTNVVVTDTIENNVAPTEWYPSKGSVEWENYSPEGGEWDGIHFGFNDLTWNIGTLTSGEEATLEIVIETLQNPNGKKAKYTPTGTQEIEINSGANVKATSILSSLSATTDGITINIVEGTICKCDKIRSLTLEYTGPGTVTIEAYDGKNDDKPLNVDPTTVSTGEEVVITPQTCKEHLGENTKIYVSGDITETQDIHTSCSQPLEVGDVYGSLTVTAVDKIYKCDPSGMGIIETNLPYSTPWAEDRYP